MAEDAVEHRERPSEPYEILVIMPDAHLDAARRVATTLAGIKVEVLPKDTPEEIEVAAQAYALGNELALMEDPKRKDIIDPEVLVAEAKEKMEDGFDSVVRVKTDILPGDVEANPRRFWEGFTKELHGESY